MMKKTSVMLVGVAVAVLAGSVGTAFAQMATPTAEPGVTVEMKRKAQNSSNYGSGKAKYRPLTVSRPAQPGNEGSNSLGTPLGASLVGGAVGVGTGAVSGAVTGVGALISTPLAALGGGPVGISAMAAPPLPIKARYANTGKVFSSYDQGWAQDVPVDASGPIYQLNEGSKRTVTPFSLIAFPIAGLASAVTTPFRPSQP